MKIEDVKNKIFCMKAEDLLEQLPEQSIDLIVTSPPYGTMRDYNGFEWDFETIAHGSYKVLKDGGVLVWVVADQTIKGTETGESFRQALYFKDAAGFNLHDTMIYKQKGTGAKGSNYAYWQGFEFMFILSKGKPKAINRIADRVNKTIGLKRGGGRYYKPNEKPHATKPIGIRDNVWEYNVGFADKSDKTEHPAPFPEALAKDHIISWSNEGDIVLDYFMGSGTVAKMAKQLDRDYIGCDISQEYVDIALKRVRQIQKVLL